MKHNEPKSNGLFQALMYYKDKIDNMKLRRDSTHSLPRMDRYEAKAREDYYNREISHLYKEGEKIANSLSNQLMSSNSRHNRCCLDRMYNEIDEMKSGSRRYNKE